MFQPSDRELLDYLCPRISPRDIAPVEGDADQDDRPDDTSDLDEKGDNQQDFYRSVLGYLYSGDHPRDTGVGSAVNTFITRSEILGLFSREQPSWECEDGLHAECPDTICRLPALGGAQEDFTGMAASSYTKRYCTT